VPAPGLLPRAAPTGVPCQHRDHYGIHQSSPQRKNPSHSPARWVGCLACQRTTRMDDLVADAAQQQALQVTQAAGTHDDEITLADVGNPEYGLGHRPFKQLPHH